MESPRKAMLKVLGGLGILRSLSRIPALLIRTHASPSETIQPFAFGRSAQPNSGSGVKREASKRTFNSRSPPSAAAHQSNTPITTTKTLLHIIRNPGPMQTIIQFSRLLKELIKLNNGSGDDPVTKHLKHSPGRAVQISINVQESYRL